MLFTERGDIKKIEVALVVIDFVICSVMDIMNLRYFWESKERHRIGDQIARSGAKRRGLVRRSIAVSHCWMVATDVQVLDDMAPEERLHIQWGGEAQAWGTPTLIAGWWAVSGQRGLEKRMASWKPEEGGSGADRKIQETGHVRWGMKTSSGFISTELTVDVGKLCGLRLTPKHKSTHYSMGHWEEQARSGDGET